MKLLLASQRIHEFPEVGERRDTLDQRFISFFHTCGYMIAPIPNFPSINSVDDFLAKFLERLMPDGIVISGGDNIGVHAERDLTEFELLTYAKKRNVPVLGICRGMQLLGVYEGVKLITVRDHTRVRHMLHGEYQDEVNSYHNHALEGCPTEYSVLAKSLDGSVEAITHKKRNWHGWMWHPERESEFQESDINRVKNIFN